MVLSAIPLFAAALGATPTQTPEALAIKLLSQEIQKRESFGVFCIQVDGKDAPQSVLTAIQTESRTVVVGSECEPVVDTSKGSYHKATGRSALLMSVEKFQPAQDGNADVDLKLYYNGLWAVYKTLEVRKTGNSWVIIRVKSHVEA